MKKTIILLGGIVMFVCGCNGTSSNVRWVDCDPLHEECLIEPLEKDDQAFKQKQEWQMRKLQEKLQQQRFTIRDLF